MTDQTPMDMQRSIALREALADTAPADGFRDWSTRDATDERQRQMRNADNYSRFVDIMKVALPVTAAAIVAVVAFVSIAANNSDGRFIINLIPNLQNDLQMLQPRITGFDAQNRPYTVTADSAVQDPDNADLVQLKTLDGTLMPAAGDSQPEKPLVTLSANDGVLNSKTQLLDVAGNVVVVSRDDYTVTTEEASIDIDTRTVVGDVPVEANGPSGRVTADRFTLLNEGDIIIFEGRVKTYIDPAKTNGTTEAAGSDEAAAAVDTDSPAPAVPNVLPTMKEAPQVAAPDVRPVAKPDNGISQGKAVVKPMIKPELTAQLGDTTDNDQQ